MVVRGGVHRVLPCLRINLGICMTLPFARLVHRLHLRLRVGTEATRAVNDSAGDPHGNGAGHQSGDLTVPELRGIDNRPGDYSVPNVPDVAEHVHRGEGDRPEDVVFSAHRVGPRELSSARAFGSRGGEGGHTFEA